MRLLILYYSRTGNNRLLANHLAELTGADIEEIRPERRFKLLGFLMDFLGHRTPKIAPIASDPAKFDHVLFIAPIYDMSIGHPIKTALIELKDRLSAYSFVTFCGYHREDQSDHIRQELQDVTGQAPAHIRELPVGDLLPEDKRGDVMAVSGHRATRAELDHFTTDIETIRSWFA